MGSWQCMVAIGCRIPRKIEPVFLGSRVRCRPGNAPMGLGEGSQEMGRNRGGGAASARGAGPFPEEMLPRQITNWEGRGGMKWHFQAMHVKNPSGEATGSVSEPRAGSLRSPASGEILRAYIEIHGFAHAVYSL